MCTRYPYLSTLIINPLFPYFNCFFTHFCHTSFHIVTTRSPETNKAQSNVLSEKKWLGFNSQPFSISTLIFCKYYNLSQYQIPYNLYIFLSRSYKICNSDMNNTNRLMLYTSFYLGHKQSNLSLHKNHSTISPPHYLAQFRFRSQMR